MSKPEEQEELTVDFFDEVEEVVDDDLAMEDEESEEEQEESSEETIEEETSEEASEETEDETEETEETEEELSLVESIRRKLGYDFEELGFESELDDTEDSIQLLVERAKDIAAEDAINSYFDQYPDVKELLEYRQLGGDPDKFFQTKFPEVDYEKVELKEDDERQQEHIIRQELREVRGMSNEEINAEIEDYRNGGILENKAKRSLSALKAKQQNDKEQLLEQQREQDKQRQEQVVEHWNNVKQTIESATSFKGFKVPSKDKNAFFEYLATPVEDGKSKAMLAHENADLETRLAVDYLLFKGFNLSDIVSRKAKDENAKTLRERMKSAKVNKKKETNTSQTFEELGEI